MRRLSQYTPGAWPLHDDEESRLEALRSLNVLDTPGERAFDSIVSFCRKRFAAPICLISLVDQNRQWFKSCYGLSVDQTGRDSSFCAHAIMPEVEGILEVCDATKDDRFCTNPLVLSDPHIRYYAGVALEVTIDGRGLKMGTLCVIDTKPRPPMGNDDQEHLKSLGSMVVDHLNSRLSSHRLQKLNSELLRRTAEVDAVNRELTAIINTANAPIFAIDSQMRVTAWNRKISEITSVSSEEVSGLQIDTVIGHATPHATPTVEGAQDAPAADKPWLNLGGDAEPGDGEKPFVTALSRALAGQSIACFDLVMSSRYHDRKIHLQVSAEPKIDSDGKVVGAVCVGEDVALRQSMLETRLRNHELQKTNEAKDAFLACMSHEMRTPLNGLLGMLQLAMHNEQAMPDDVRRFVKQAMNSGRLLLSLINDILDITRIEAGQLELDQRCFHLKELLEETLALVRPKALDKCLRLDLIVDGEVQDARLVGDMSRVQQVLLNLLWNALKFTTTGHVRLKVRHATTSDRDTFAPAHSPMGTKDGGTGADANGVVQLLFEVEDTGVGIPVEEQTYIFQRFARAAAARRHDSQHVDTGIGLGMSICKQLVGLMGGQIWLHSAVSVGTRVFVHLAFRHAMASDVSEQSVSPTSEMAVTGASADSSSKGGSKEQSARRASVLVVEDNDYNVDVCKQMLEMLGHNVTVATNGWEALSLIAIRDINHEASFDVVMMDCDMPIMNGFDATRAIRRWERTGAAPTPPPGIHPLKLSRGTFPERALSRHPLPIIAVTAYAMSGDKTLCFEAGMDDYITKPLSISVLRDRIAVHTAHAPISAPSTCASSSSCSSATIHTSSPYTLPHEPSTEGPGSGLPPVGARLGMRDNPLVALMKEHSISSGLENHGKKPETKDDSRSTPELPSVTSSSSSPQASFLSASAQHAPPDMAALPQGLLGTASGAAGPSHRRPSAAGPHSPAVAMPLPTAGVSASTANAEKEAAAAPSELLLSQPPFSLSDIKDIFGGSLKLVRMALSRYDTSAFHSLDEQYKKRNFVRLMQLAHQLKGGSAYICAKDAKAAAMHLEMRAKDLIANENDPALLEDVGRALQAVGRELERIGPAIQVALQELDTNE